MGDKNKSFALPAPKTIVKSKRPSTVGSTASSRTRNPPLTSKNNRANITRINEADITLSRENTNLANPDLDSEYKQIACGKRYRDLLENLMLDEKIEREQTATDLHIVELMERLREMEEHLDRTNRRLKSISFSVEHKRLLDLKSNDCTQFYEALNKAKTQDVMNSVKSSLQPHLDKLETKNVDFGYDKDSGHKQLLDAVNDALAGLEQIKKRSNLDINKFQEIDDCYSKLKQQEKDIYDLENCKVEFEDKLPDFMEKLLKETSEKVAKMIENDDDEEDD